MPHARAVEDIWRRCVRLVRSCDAASVRALLGARCSAGQLPVRAANRRGALLPPPLGLSFGLRTRIVRCGARSCEVPHQATPAARTGSLGKGAKRNTTRARAATPSGAARRARKSRTRVRSGGALSVRGAVGAATQHWLAAVVSQQQASPSCKATARSGAAAAELRAPTWPPRTVSRQSSHPASGAAALGEIGARRASGACVRRGVRGKGQIGWISGARPQAGCWRLGREDTVHVPRKAIRVFVNFARGKRGCEAAWLQRRGSGAEGGSDEGCKGGVAVPRCRGHEGWWYVLLLCARRPV
eukprot:360157-Chlamydomonas_euryale.AAC.4